MRIDGTEMCRALPRDLLRRGFACVDGPEFDAFGIVFDEAILRSKMYRREEREEDCQIAMKKEFRCKLALPGRVKDFSEVALGYTKEEALFEAERCLDCKHVPLRRGLPRGEIDIPKFIRESGKEGLEGSRENHL